MNKTIYDNISLTCYKYKSCNLTYDFCIITFLYLPKFEVDLQHLYTEKYIKSITCVCNSIELQLFKSIFMYFKVIFFISKTYWVIFSLRLWVFRIILYLWSILLLFFYRIYIFEPLFWQVLVVYKQLMCDNESVRHCIHPMIPKSR